MLIAEHIDDDGDVHRTTLDVSPNGALLEIDGAASVLPVRAILLAMRRFGRPLDSALSPDGERLDLGHGFHLRLLQYRAMVDVEPKTYLVLEGDPEPLCALSTEIAGALSFIAQKSR